MDEDKLEKDEEDSFLRAREATAGGGEAVSSRSIGLSPSAILLAARISVSLFS